MILSLDIFCTFFNSLFFVVLFKRCHRHYLTTLLFLIFDRSDRTRRKLKTLWIGILFVFTSCWACFIDFIFKSSFFLEVKQHTQDFGTSSRHGVIHFIILFIILNLWLNCPLIALSFVFVLFIFIKFYHIVRYYNNITAAEISFAKKI